MPTKLALADANQLITTSSASPSNQVTIGTVFIVYVKAYIDSSSSPQTATGSLTYPSNLVKVNGTSTSGGGFGSPTITNGSGAISFSASRSSSDTGVVQIFSVTFQATASGTAIIGFSGDSKVNGGTTAYKTTVISITNPNPPASSSPTPKPSQSTKPSVNPVPVVSSTPSLSPESPTDDASAQPTPDPTGVVSDVNVDPSYTAGTVTWKVNAPNPKSILAYGTNSSSLDKQATIQTKPDGTFTTNITGLSPGVRYYFMITGSGDGGKTGNYSGSIITNGFPVVITVTENNTAAQNAQLRIGSLTRSTSSNGKVTIGLAAGSYSGTITTSSASLDIKLTVAAKTVPADGSTPESQTFSYNLTSSVLEQGPGSGNSILVFIGALACGTVLLGLGFVGFMAYRRRKFEMGSGSSGPTTTVIIDDGYNWHQETSAPSAPSTPSTDSQSASRHNNSVYINDEEPVDIFDKK